MGKTISTGTWKLKSWKAIYKGGSEAFSFRADAQGFLIYDALGNVVVTIHTKCHKKIQSENLLDATDTKIVTAFKGFMSYFGLFTIDTTKKQVVPHVEICSFPSRNGKDQVRRYEL